MGPTVLLTLGRLPKALELARALAGAGCRVILAEPFGAHLCKPSRAVAKSYRTPAPAQDQAAYLKALEEIIARERVELVVPIGEEALHASLLSQSKVGFKLYGPGHATLARLHDKLAFIETARGHGLPAPETFPSDRPEAASLAARADHVLKPRHACSGQGLRLRLAGAPLAAEDRAPGQVLQRRIHGRHLSAQCIAENGRMLACAVYEGRIFSGTVAVLFARVEAEAVEDWCARFIAAEAYTGFIAFDFIADAAGPWPLECNPRLTSGVHFFEPADLAACVLGRPPERVRFKPQRMFQEGHTALLEAYGEPKRLFERLRLIRGAKDVLWSARDPLPFLLMTPMSWGVLRQVLFEGRSFGEAATRDIVWAPPAEAAISAGASHAP